MSQAERAGLTRYCVNLSDQASKVWFDYMKKSGLKRDAALDALLREFGGSEPEPPIDPTKYDVEISQTGGLLQVRSGIKQIISVPKADAANAFQIAVSAVPPGGSLGIGEGTYELTAPYPIGLNADWSNIFYCCIPILDKGMHIHGAGVGKTILKLAPWQRSGDRHVAMMLIRGRGPMDAGYSSFTLEGLTFDGNAKFQYAATPYDGEALILVGSERRGGKFENLEFKNSFGTGLYLGNNGSGSGKEELVKNVIARSCADKGIMLDTCQDSKVEACQAWQCGEGLCLYGNDDWETRGADRVCVDGFQTDSQVTVWQVNDFRMMSVDMDCTKAAKSYGLVVRDGSGQIALSALKSDKKKASAYGSATYIYRGASVGFQDCQISGYYGIRAIERAEVLATNCDLAATGGCFCMVDQNEPMQACITADGCRCTGKKVELQEGATFDEI